MIVDVDKNDHIQLIEIWQAAVLATHNFLSTSEVNRLKQAILTIYFDAVTLKGLRNSLGQWVGFVGTSADKIEMLFVDPKYHGQGFGAMLCRYAISELGITKVDVNEQNPKAMAFYNKMGFEVFARSETDGEGKPYPILHMQLFR